MIVKWWPNETLLGIFSEVGEGSRVFTDIGARLAGSNTASLVERGWSGNLVEMNSDSAHALRRAFPEQRVIEVMATPENINELVHPDSHFLDIDVDGNDYHLWEALEINPKVVMIESGVGMAHDFVPEYDPESKKRMNGPGVKALMRLGALKGYRFYDKQSVNLYFVRRD